MTSRPLRCTRRPGRLGAVLLAALTAVALVVPSGPASAASPVATTAASAAATGWHSGPCTPADVSAVTVVVDFQDLGGVVVTRCALGLRSGATGRQALTAAGIGVEGAGASFVCRLLGRPKATEVIPIPGNPSYRESCASTPPASAYWAYWSARPGGPWTYNTQGYTSRRVTIGGYEGWSFSHNKAAGTNPAPRVAATPHSVKGLGTASGTKYRGGNSAAGGISYGVGVQVWKNSAGTVTHIRGIGRISKLSKVTAVQVDQAVLGTATGALRSTTAALNSGAATYVASVTGWVAVKAGTCLSYRARANFSIRWADTALSTFSILSPLTRVCRAAGT